jgi:hypothetical protein
MTFFYKEDEKPIADNLLRAYRIPRKGQENVPDFSELLARLHVALDKRRGRVDDRDGSARN